MHSMDFVRMGHEVISVTGAEAGIEAFATLSEDDT